MWRRREVFLSYVYDWLEFISTGTNAQFGSGNLKITIKAVLLNIDIQCNAECALFHFFQNKWFDSQKNQEALLWYNNVKIKYVFMNSDPLVCLWIKEMIKKILSMKWRHHVHVCKSKRMSASVHFAVHLQISPEAGNWLAEVTVEGRVAADCAVLHCCLQRQLFKICAHFSHKVLLVIAQQLHGRRFLNCLFERKPDVAGFLSFSCCGDNSNH